MHSSLESAKKSDHERKAKGHKNFYIDLQQPPNFRYADGDIVRGKCVLLSSHDEDVGSVVISFHGTVNVKLSQSNTTQGGPSTSNYAEEQVLFQESLILYQGTYKLRKDVLYEWPFEFQFPIGLPPNGAYGSMRASGAIQYELKACRGRTWQDSQSLLNHLNPNTDMRGAPFQPNNLFTKIGSFTGMIATAVLTFTPARPRHLDPAILILKIDHRLPVIYGGGERSKSKIGGHFHIHHSLHPTVGCTIALQVSKNLVHGVAIPCLLSITPNEPIPLPSLPRIILQSLEIVLLSRTSVHESGKHGTFESKTHLLEAKKINTPLDFNSWLDLGFMFGIGLSNDTTPTFTTAYMNLKYDFKFHWVMECGGQKIAHNFDIEDVKVFSNRMPSSPLRRDFICTFIVQRHPSTTFSISSSDEEIIGAAFLSLSRLLSQNNILHHPLPPGGPHPAVLIQGQYRNPQSAPSGNATSYLDAVASGSSTTHNPAGSSAPDQKLLDNIFNDQPHIREASSKTPGVFAYIWEENDATQFSSGNLPAYDLAMEQPHGRKAVRLEISDASAPPPTRLVPSQTSLSLPRLLTSLLSTAACYTPASRNTNPVPSFINDILYLTQEFGAELLRDIGFIDGEAADLAVLNFPSLRWALESVGWKAGDRALELGRGMEKGKEKDSAWD